jgi:hypothetical protein
LSTRKKKHNRETTQQRGRRECKFHKKVEHCGRFPVKAVLNKSRRQNRSGQEGSVAAKKTCIRLFLL